MWCLVSLEKQCRAIQNTKIRRMEFKLVIWTLKYERGSNLQWLWKKDWAGSFFCNTFKPLKSCASVHLMIMQQNQGDFFFLHFLWKTQLLDTFHYYLLHKGYRQQAQQYVQVLLVALISPRSVCHLLVLKSGHQVWSHKDFSLGQFIRDMGIFAFLCSIGHGLLPKISWEFCLSNSFCHRDSGHLSPTLMQLQLMVEAGRWREVFVFNITFLKEHLEFL